ALPPPFRVGLMRNVSSCFFGTHRMARVAIPLSSSRSTDAILNGFFPSPDGSAEPSMLLLKGFLRLS
ncbi:hypothetical protein VN97_g12753, partial [Penicillium thymicola]